MSGDIVTNRAGPPTRHVVRETAISIAINGSISAGFFQALFGGRDPSTCRASATLYSLSCPRVLWLR
jgi:hypothetical protein